MSIDNDKMKKVLEQLNAWCTKHYPQVQSVYDDCAGYTLHQLVYYLLGVVKNCVDQVIESSDAFNELDGKFNDLYTFVNEYFTNLDVQEEINNKLEEMFKSGQLYTLLNLFIPYVTLEMYGGTGDGITDDTNAFIEAVKTNKLVVGDKSKKYLIKNCELLNVNIKDINFIVDGNVLFKTNNSSEYALIANNCVFDYNSGLITCERDSNWGTPVYINNCRFYNYYIGLEINTPFNVFIVNTRFTGTGFNRNAENPNLGTGDSIGIKLNGFSNYADFSNMVTINNCTFDNNLIGLQAESVQNLLIMSCIFEPNYINMYVFADEGDQSTLHVMNTWIEDYTNLNQPIYGAYSLYPINFNTGDLQPNTKMSRLSTFNLVCTHVNVYEKFISNFNKFDNVIYSNLSANDITSYIEEIGCMDGLLYYKKANEKLTSPSTIFRSKNSNLTHTENNYIYTENINNASIDTTITIDADDGIFDSYIIINFSSDVAVYKLSGLYAKPEISKIYDGSNLSENVNVTFNEGNVVINGESTTEILSIRIQHKTITIS